MEVGEKDVPRFDGEDLTFAQPVSEVRREKDVSDRDQHRKGIEVEKSGKETYAASFETRGVSCRSMPR